MDETSSAGAAAAAAPKARKRKIRRVGWKRKPKAKSTPGGPAATSVSRNRARLNGLGQQAPKVPWTKADFDKWKFCPRMGELVKDTCFVACKVPLDPEVYETDYGGSKHEFSPSTLLDKCLENKWRIGLVIDATLDNYFYCSKADWQEWDVEYFKLDPVAGSGPIDHMKPIPNEVHVQFGSKMDQFLASQGQDKVTDGVVVFCRYGFNISGALIAGFLASRSRCEHVTEALFMFRQSRLPGVYAPAAIAQLQSLHPHQVSRRYMPEPPKWDPQPDVLAYNVKSSERGSSSRRAKTKRPRRLKADSFITFSHRISDAARVQSINDAISSKLRGWSPAELDSIRKVAPDCVSSNLADIKAGTYWVSWLPQGYRCLLVVHDGNTYVALSANLIFPAKVPLIVVKRDQNQSSAVQPVKSALLSGYICKDAQPPNASSGTAQFRLMLEDVLCFEDREFFNTPLLTRLAFIKNDILKPRLPYEVAWLQHSKSDFKLRQNHFFPANRIPEMIDNQDKVTSSS